MYNYPFSALIQVILNLRKEWQNKVTQLNKAWISTHSGRVKPLELSSLDIELTERCNNACLHCYINLPENDMQARNRELTTSEWKDILRQAAELGIFDSAFHRR